MESAHDHRRPLSIAMVAERWDVSVETVRQMIHRGELEAFRAGKKLIRIPIQAVEKHECQASPSDVSEEGSVSTGGTIPANVEGISLKHAPERKRKPKPSLSTNKKQRETYR